MKKQLLTLVGLALILPGLLQACAGGETPEAEAPETESTAETPETQASGETGTLQIRANGEDFVRQGFVSKDGWEISFDHLYVNLADLTAYQTEPPYEPEAGDELQASQEVKVEEVKTIDLAEGDENAEPVLVEEVEAPPGRYNALSWQMVNADEGPASGYAMVIQGVATKDGETVNFTLNIDEELAFSCGDFVGDERKGILEPGGTADVEATFHFDHLFGDGEAAPDDELNVGALGFQPLADLAEGGELTVDTTDLGQNLSEEDYNKLLEILPSLGHVGEGHCEETQLTT
ncbi:DUF4382 domain-containing protein [Leptolyngbya sp. FACHB-671]|uniref:DUF4382 domain-containing protein n=1 Tax=Leptolyngbya sp. FACHB-671 TaxID=2692812 RepID=UPI0016853389|nr:DUF4382 domain-containing protein [Leptolyngbya sp. FACHB-671]MBD1866545.1 DUF4382 domain-containing protein [Cyanobacteria bacterium FACHB-471]MBD2070443.1 DUF4382 domain-containing protein [Leptolyngbya sp. FACHB-671]